MTRGFWLSFAGWMLTTAVSVAAPAPGLTPSPAPQGSPKFIPSPMMPPGSVGQTSGASSFSSSQSLSPATTSKPNDVKVSSVKVNEPSYPLTLCRKSQEVRSIRIEKVKEGVGCEAYYTKSTNSQLIGKSIRNMGCEAFVQRVVANLEGSDWKCRQVSEKMSELNQGDTPAPSKSKQ